jgi:hypothetical protein
VVLRPGAVASALLEGLNAPVEGKRCRRYAALRITVPNEASSVVRRVGHALCYPEIHPVVPGKTAGTH